MVFRVPFSPRFYLYFALFSSWHGPPHLIPLFVVIPENYVSILLFCSLRFAYSLVIFTKCQLFLSQRVVHMLCASKQTVFCLATLLSKTLCFAKVIESFHAQQVQKLFNFILFMPLNSEIVAFIFIMIFLFFPMWNFLSF